MSKNTNTEITFNFTGVQVEHVEAGALTANLKGNRKTARLAAASKRLAASYAVKSRDWYNRIADVDALAQSGLSHRQIVVVVTDANQGERPSGFSAAEVGRLAMAGKAIRTTLAEVLAGSDDAKHDAARYLANLARTVSGAEEAASARITRVSDLAAKTGNAVDALAILQGESLALSRTDTRAALAEATPATRTPGGITNQTEAPATDDADADDTPATSGTRTNATDAVSLMGFSTARLLTDLTRRDASEWTQADVEALEALAAQVAAFVAREVEAPASA